MRSSNLPPEISKLDIPDLSTADGTTHQTRLNLRWDVSDPNDDELNFTVQVRKEGWPSWITLFETPITERTYSWDSTAFPSGSYRVRLVASDRPSNSAETCFSRDRESPPFLIDHEPPQITVRPQEKKAVVVLADALTRVTKAEYSNRWRALEPALSGRRTLRYPPRTDHRGLAGAQARHAFADGPRHRRSRECRLGRRAVRRGELSHVHAVAENAPASKRLPPRST